ncbi:hypothetical protein LTR36_010425 [Oleoguttula mirabilis]|uniref:Zn(2)-C6 fungal-type domain-containing protein n=1 Tax=Oleoguttula mirabilis TaxID=1507867 RepID=A0AAV9J503_9PEZI|nr:hypothetical protein LTR36_010425 [Oleoguttula mirabilis]
MLPGTTQSEYAEAQHYRGRRPSQSGQQPPPYGYSQRPTIELPRPLEPRPTHHLQSSLSEASGTQRHQDAFRGPAAGPSDYRAHGPSLPGLRDILTPQPTLNGHPGYNVPWNTNAPPPLAPHSSDGYHGHRGWHPPLALHPSTDPRQSYQAPPSRPLELPILQTSPLSQHPPQSLPVSPYNGYPEARDYGDVRPERPRQASSTCYLTNSVATPYTAGPEDTPYRNAMGNYERLHNGALPPGAPECQRKYLGIKDVNGEGSYHMYEGGFRIPTNVDGEPVNPAWGLTKANKPRKRLALACLDCREKKIKCEPGANGCLQCEKAKRSCQRPPAHQPSSEGVSASPPVWDGNDGSPVRKGISDPTPQGTRELDPEPLNKRRSREDPSPPNVPTKKHRSASPVATTDAAPAGPGYDTTAATPVAVDIPHEGGPKALTWEEDPYNVDREIVLHLLELYFTHINSATYCLFPRNAFIHWVRTCVDKCLNERMVLYAVLAVASVFADDQLSGFGKRCAQIAKDAISAQLGHHNMFVVQARLLVGIYHFARGAYGVAWDYSGSAIRASTSPDLRLNDEKDRDQEYGESLGSVRKEFGFTTNQLKECKRRTFWSCFLMDRYENGTLCAITVQDIFLRLPCADDAYEQGLPSGGPYFNNGGIDAADTILTPTSPICPMGWLALIAAIWGDALNFTNRAVHWPDSTYRQAYISQYSETHIQVQGWSSRLPEYLQYSEANLDRSIQCGYAGTFISMHALHSFVLIRINRYVRHAQVPDLIPRNIRAAHYHAHTLLTMMGAVQKSRRGFADTGTGRPTDSVLATPFVGHAIMSATDIVGAGGLDSNLGTTLDVMNGGLSCLREMAKSWNSARDQLKECERRYYQIHNILTRPFKAQSGAWLGREWGMKDPLEKEFASKNDCIYADDAGGDGYTRIYFDALREDARDRAPPIGGLRIA